MFLTRFSAGLGLLALTACAAQTPTESGHIALEVSALSGTCGSAASAAPLSEIKSFKLVVRQPNGDGTFSVLGKTLTSGFSGGKTITFSEVPAGSALEVTLTGLLGNGTTAWFARKSSLTVKKQETQAVDVTLMASEGFTCVGLTDTNVNKLAFPAATTIAGGKILITGGFADKVVDGTDFVLSSALSKAYIFDPAKGTLKEAGNLSAARGAHSVVYLTKSNKILVVGGVQQMRVKADGTEPPRWSPTDKASPLWELCSLDNADHLSCTTDNDSQLNLRARVLPNLMPLTADYVVVSGGAPWPTTDTGEYRCADLFDPTLTSQVDGGKGAFAKLKAGDTCMNAPRATSAVAQFSRVGQNGTLNYLIWGGNEAIVGGATNTPAGKPVESFVESTNLGSGFFNDAYTLTGDYDEKNGTLFFSTLVSLGTAKTQDAAGADEIVDLFAAVGGARYSDGAKWQKPSKDDAYFLVVHAASNGKGASINIKRMGGMTDGMYMGNATATGGHVVVTGGFTDIKGGGATLTQFDAVDGDPLAPLVGSVPPAASSFIPRGALSASRLSNDCILLFGGVTDFNDLHSPDPATNIGANDVYCPGFLAP